MSLYSNIIDPEVITDIIPADWQYQRGLVGIGAVTLQSPAMEGTQEDFIKETLFQTDHDGQVVGIGTELTLKNLVQTQYHIPLVWRGDGAILYALQGEISPKRAASIQSNVTNAILDKATKIFDGVAISIAQGIAKYQEANTENFKDTGATQVNLLAITELKSLLGEQGLFQGGYMVMEGAMFQKFVALGLTTEGNNTYGVSLKDAIVSAGSFSTVLGMTPVVSDRITGATGDTDHYIMFLQPGGLLMKGSPKPEIYPVQQTERGFDEIVKFKMKAGGTVAGMSWGGTKSDQVSNSALATAANWTRAASNAKNVKMATLRVPAPKFTA